MDWERKHQEALSDPRSAEELIRLILAETDEDAAWKLIGILQHRGNRETLEAARQLCRSSDHRRRQLGVDILGQLGIPDRSFPDESLSILLELLQREEDADVLSSIGIACGHLHDPRAIVPLTQLKAHPSSDVRYGVVFGLLGQEDDEAIATLIELSADTDPHVRDWATFGLGSQIDTDTSAVREALIARLDDTYDDARGEALVGLARRGDGRVVEPLLGEFLVNGVGSLHLKAASDIGDPRLYPALLRLREQIEDDAYLGKLLEEALERCK